MNEKAYRTNDRRVIWWLLLALLVIFGGMYAATYHYTDERIARGTTVNGIAIGGMRPAAAQRKLTAGLQGRAAEPITVTAEGQRATIRPARAGLTVEVPATVAQAGTKPSWDPRRLWDYFAGNHEQDAVVTVDGAALDRAVATFAQQVDDPAVEGSVRFSHGEARARYPEKGTLLDRAAAASAIRSAFLHGGRPEDVVALRTRVATPAVTKDAVSRAMDQFANPAMSGPVVVRLDEEGVQLQPEDFSAALSVQAVGSQLRPQLDDAALLAALKPKMRSLARAPRDATIRVVNGTPRVVAARDGLTFKPEDVTGGFLGVVAGSGAGRTLRVRSVPASPDVSTADIQALRITQRVSGFTTRFPYAAYRNINLGRAAQLINGTIIRPGETFSLNRTVGERTAANGFTKGYIIADGVFAEDFGGGVSQVATTTFNAAFFAGLVDVEHKAHSFYISRYPVGREATVAWPDIDLSFKNTTPYGVLVQASIDKATPSRTGAMRVTMYSTKYWDILAEKSPRYDATPPRTRHLKGPGCVPNQGYDGFDINVYRLFYRTGSDKLDHRETMHTSYTPSDTVICS